MYSSAGGVAILIPAYFVCAGILFFTAIVSVLACVARSHVRLYLAFGAMCLSAGGYTSAVAGYHLADSAAGAVYASIWQMDWGAGFLVSLVAFVALYSRMPRMRWVVGAAALPAVAFVVANHVLPYGARYSELTSFRWLFLPWGEGLFTLEGHPSAWNYAFRIYTAAIAAWSVWRLASMYREQRRLDSLVLAIYITVLFLLTLQGAMIDMGILKTFQWVPFGAVGLAMLMAISLTADLASQNRALRVRARELRDAQERLDRAMDAANIALFEVDVATGNVYLSESWAVMLGRERLPTRTTVKELLGHVHPEESETLWQVAIGAIKGNGDSYEAEHRVRKDDGTWIWILSRARVVERDAAARVLKMAGTNIDVTERKSAEQRIHHLSTRDALTNLPNRTSFAQAAAAALDAKPAGLAILSIGLDRFATINDSLGHAAGDLVLRRIAGRIAARAGAPERTARAGADEFLVLVPELGERQEAEAHAESLREAIAAPLRVEDHEVVVTASVGIAVFPGDGKSTGVLLRNADTALHSAKKANGNAALFFAPHMNADAQERFAGEVDLRRALARKEFVVHYQPKVDLASGRIVGHEALVRWQHPELGLLPPGRFLDVAEDTGLILVLGEQVLLDACRQAAGWSGRSRDSTVAVNVSAQQFRDAGFVGVVERALQSTGLDPRRLELEIVENAIMDHGPETLASLARLSAMGVALAIDDFGTGYSSLGYLLRLPIDTVKIDKSFVEAAPGSREASTIVRTVISLAHGLGLKVVAEGVESEEQVEFLRQHGCDQAQGYRFAPPLPSDQVTFEWTRETASEAAD